MSQVTLFISAVSDEFAEDPKRSPDRIQGPGDYRTYLRDKLTCPDVCVKVQEDFIAGGVLTLDKLVIYLNACDAVIHLVGDMTGAPASAAAVESILASEPALGQRLPFLSTPADALALGVSYTQWEAYLALYFGKRLVVCAAEPHAVRAGRYTSDEGQRQRQADHLARLKALKRHPEISFATREELAIEVLRMLRTLLPASQRESLPAPPCRLPYPPLGDRFIGRDELLKDIRARVERAQEKGRWPRHVVHGLGGMGKTRVAVEYAWRYRDQYAAVLLISGESSQSLDRDLAALTDVLHLGCDPTTPEPQRARMVTDWLQQNPGWLLVVDNVDTEEARDTVIGRLPDWVNGHVLMTARVSDWPRDVELLDLRVLTPADATRFLLEATEGRRSVRPDDAEQAHRLANDELGGLCLALEQAAAYMTKLQISLADYRQRWTSNAKDVRKRADKKLMRYHEEKEVSLSVATTWQTTVDDLSAAARALLEMLSWLAPELLPVGLFEHEGVAEQLQALTANQDDDVEYALAELRGYSLLSGRQTASIESAGQVHRLVQLVTRDSLSPEQQRRTLMATLSAFGAYASFDEEETEPSIFAALGPHLDALIAHTDRAGITVEVTPLLRVRGALWQAKSLFTDAEAQFRRALAIDEAALGSQDPVIADDMCGLADVLITVDRFEEAEPLYRRALAIDEACFGKDDPRIAKHLRSLSLLLLADNRLEEAEQQIRRALAINEKTFGLEHNKVASNLIDLGRMYWSRRQLDQAEPLLRRALAIKEKQFGVDHPNTAVYLCNLAVVLKDKKSFAEAESLLRRAISIEEAEGGGDSPSFALVLNNLAQLLEASGRSDEAEGLLRRSIAINEKSLGAKHRSLARDLNNLALLLKGKGQMEEAEVLMRRAVSTARESVGDDHPEYATMLTNLTLLLVQTGRSEEAEPLIRTALTIDETSFGLEHPNSVRDISGLVRVLRALNRGQEAEDIVRRAIARNEVVFGPDHDHVSMMLFELAWVLAGIGRAVEAEPLLQRSLALDEKNYGPTHTIVANDLKMLGDIFAFTERVDEARSAYLRAQAIYERAYGPESPNVTLIRDALAQLDRSAEPLANSDSLSPPRPAIDDNSSMSAQNS